MAIPVRPDYEIFFFKVRKQLQTCSESRDFITSLQTPLWMHPISRDPLGQQTSDTSQNSHKKTNSS